MKVESHVHLLIYGVVGLLVRHHPKSILQITGSIAFQTRILPPATAQAFAPRIKQ
jgi:hypothetical protein